MCVFVVCARAPTHTNMYRGLSPLLYLHFLYKTPTRARARPLFVYVYVNKTVGISYPSTKYFTYINMNMRPQHITITSIKYLISYPINMKVSNQVFTTSNSNKCVGGLCTVLVFIRLG